MKSVALGCENVYCVSVYLFYIVFVLGADRH